MSPGQTPGHDHAPQTGDSPALFTVARQRVEPGQLISLVLATKDNSTFKGFMVQARNAELKDQQVLISLSVLLTFSHVNITGWQLCAVRR